MKISELHTYYLDSAGVSTDSRTVRPDQIFFALSGENFDGNQYAQQALDKGAKYAVVSDKSLKSKQCFYFEDVLLALQELALYHRKSLDIPVLGITGSNGKTTTKELLTSVLSLKYKVHATRGNFNNHIGVPLTLLEVGSDIEFLVVEMGANHIGEIKFLSELACPEYGLITNIGMAHIEGFGSYEGVKIAKSELYRYIKGKGNLVFYNSEDMVLKELLPNEIRAVPYRKDIVVDASSICLSIGPKDSKEALIPTRFVGAYNRANMLAALTVGDYFGIATSAMLSAIAGYQPENNRSQLIERDGLRIVMDAYNANPTSMRHSIISLAKQASEKAKVLILGDMKELGAESVKMHKEILDLVQQYDWKSVILVGRDFAAADKDKQFVQYSDVETMSKSPEEILTLIKDSDCLIKASRSIKLEKLLDFIF